MTTPSAMIEVLRQHEEGRALLKLEPSNMDGPVELSELEFYALYTAWFAKVMKLWRELRNKPSGKLTQTINNVRTIAGLKKDGNDSSKPSSEPE